MPMSSPQGDGDEKSEDSKRPRESAKKKAFDPTLNEDEKDDTSEGNKRPCKRAKSEKSWEGNVDTALRTKCFNKALFDTARMLIRKMNHVRKKGGNDENSERKYESLKIIVMQLLGDDPKSTNREQEVALQELRELRVELLGDVLKSKRDIDYNEEEIHSLSIQKYPGALLIVDAKGFTLLHHVLMSATPSLKMLSLMLKICPKAATVRDGYGKTPLYAAYRNNHTLEIFSMVLQAYPDAVMAKDYHGNTLIHTICERKEKNHGRMLEYLLKKCPKAAEQKNREGKTPLFLYIASDAGVSFDVLSMFLRYDPEAMLKKDNVGNTPLHFMVSENWEKKREKMLHFLLELYPLAAGEKNKQGMTPLHYFVSSSKAPGIVEMLLKTYPEAALENDRNNGTPLHIVCSKKRDSVSREDELRQITLLLKKCPVSIRKQNRRGFTPLQLAHADFKTHLANIDTLLEPNVEQKVVKRVLDYFVKEKWWGGVGILMDLHPTILQNIDLEDKQIPGLYCKIGSECKLLTMWKVIRNKQDLFN